MLISFSYVFVYSTEKFKISDKNCAPRARCRNLDSESFFTPKGYELSLPNVDYRMSPELTKHFTSDSELGEKVAKYRALFVSAWNDLLDDLANGKVNYPSNEHEFRGLLYAKCLELMKENAFETPYEIHAEDKAVYGADIADLTLGDLREFDTSARALTVEIKLDPTSESVISTIKKLQEYVVKDRLFYASFVALGT